MHALTRPLFEPNPRGKECWWMPCGALWETMSMAAAGQRARVRVGSPLTLTSHAHHTLTSHPHLTFLPHFPEEAGTLLMSEAQVRRHYEEHPEKRPEGLGYWAFECGFCRHCPRALPSLCGVCQYMCCVYLPSGRFCPGRQYPCACGDASPSSDHCSPSLRRMDAAYLSERSMGPGWICTSGSASAGDRARTRA